MHKLFAQNLDTETNLDVFFQKYLGSEVLETLNNSIVNFSAWPLETKEALRALCIHFAEQIPEADHVIRHDVDTPRHCPPGIPGNLLMYFGIQFSNDRGQFTGVSYEKDKNFQLNLFIAGSIIPATIASLKHHEDPDDILTQNTISNLDDFNKIQKSLIEINPKQRKIISYNKNTFGFNPDFCWERGSKDNRLTSKNAGTIYFNYYLMRKKSLSVSEQEKEKNLLCENNYYRKNIAIAYIEEHVDVEQAYLWALSTHA
jgi:hypothetical protein